MEDDAGRGESRESMFVSVGVGSDFELGIPDSVRGGEGGCSSIGGSRALSIDGRWRTLEGGLGVVSFPKSKGRYGTAVAVVDVLGRALSLLVP